MLNDAVVKQIESGIERLLDEGGYGEVALVIANGELKHVERRPIIRMHVPRMAGPPGERAIECRTKTG